MVGNVRWTHELVREEALKYKTRNKFRKGNNAAYQYACKHKLLDKICNHMVGNVRWTHELVREQYKTRNELRKSSNGAYEYARKHNLLDELFPKKNK